MWNQTATTLNCKDMTWEYSGQIQPFKRALGDQMRAMKFIATLLIFSLASCTTMNTSQETRWETEEQEKAEVIVFRENAWTSRAVEAGFGSGSNYVVALKPMEYAALSIPVSEDKLRVGSPQSVPSNVSVSLSQSETTCISVEAAVAPIILAVTIPVLYWVLPTFTGQVVTCPDNEELKQYNKVTTS